MKKAFAIKAETAATIFLVFVLFLPLYLRSRRLSFYVFLAAAAGYGILAFYRLVKARKQKEKRGQTSTVASLKHRVQTILPLRLGLNNLFISLLLLQWFIHYQSRQGILHFSFSIHDILVYGGSIVSLNLLVQFMDSAASGLPKTRFLLNSLLIYLCYLIGFYHYITRSPFDFSVIIENAGEAFTMESVEAIVESVGLWAIFAPLAVIAVLALMEIFGKINFTNAQEKPALIKAFSALLLYVIIFFSPLHTMDDMTYFFETAYDYYTHSSPYVVEYNPGEFPLVKESTSDHRFQRQGEKQPHVFIIMVESFNAGFVEARKPEDQTVMYMPFFNKKIGEGIYVDRFYANSIQTCKGQLAVLCSIVPSLRGKIFNRYDELSLLSLPEILRASGYDTVFFQASKNLRFDNTELFMKRNGFTIVETAYSYLNGDEKKILNGWYMRDHVFYEKFFQFLDARREDTPGKPIFAVLATLYNHSGFNHVPAKDRTCIPHPGPKRSVMPIPFT